MDREQHKAALTGALPEVLAGKAEIKKSPAEIKEEILELFEKLAAGM